MEVTTQHIKATLGLMNEGIRKTKRKYIVVEEIPTKGLIHHVKDVWFMYGSCKGSFHTATHEQASKQCTTTSITYTWSGCVTNLVDVLDCWSSPSRIVEEALRKLLDLLSL